MRSRAYLEQCLCPKLRNYHIWMDGDCHVSEWGRCRTAAEACANSKEQVFMK